jgi:hypothetical protein
MSGDVSKPAEPPAPAARPGPPAWRGIIPFLFLVLLVAQILSTGSLEHWLESSLGFGATAAIVVVWGAFAVAWFILILAFLTLEHRQRGRC